MDEFATAFQNSDSLCVLDIYAASERPIPGVTGEALAEKISAAGNRSASYAASFTDAVTLVTAAAQEGDMILTLGAGSVSQLGPQILEKLQAREAAATAQPTVAASW